MFQSSPRSLFISPFITPHPNLFTTCTSSVAHRPAVRVCTQLKMLADNKTAFPILVTGASGFIGSHLVKALLSEGFTVHAVSRTASQDWPIDPRFHYQYADLTDTESLLSLIQHQKWYTVIHLAGLVSYSSYDLAAMRSINTQTTKTVVNSLSLHTKLILISTVAAVGSNDNSKQPPLTEGHPCNPNSRESNVSYALTKREAEDLVVSAALEGRARATVVCPSNVYGAGDGKKASRKTQIKAANGKWPIYTDGGVNMVHVDVLVQALLALVETPIEDPLWRGERWLITGENVTIRNMLSMCAEQGGNEHRKPWLKLPYFLLWILCCIGERLGSKSFTTDRLAMATRYHWYDGRKARDRFQLKEISARECIVDSVEWMKQNGLVKSSAPNT